MKEATSIIMKDPLTLCPRRFPIDRQLAEIVATYYILLTSPCSPTALVFHKPHIAYIAIRQRA